MPSRSPKRRKSLIPLGSVEPSGKDGLKKHSRKLVTLALRQLLRLVREYPREAVLAAVREAARYGLYDLDRVERMILRQVARDYFLLKNDDGEQ